MKKKNENEDEDEADENAAARVRVKERYPTSAQPLVTRSTKKPVELEWIPLYDEPKNPVVDKKEKINDAPSRPQSICTEGAIFNY